MDTASRLELIRAKARRGGEKSIVTQPKGLHLAATGGPQAYRKPSNAPATRGRVLSDAFKPLEVLRPLDYLTRVKERGGQEWEPTRRHGVHPLTRIAEKMKRRWQ